MLYKLYISKDKIKVLKLYIHTRYKNITVNYYYIFEIVARLIL